MFQLPKVIHYLHPLLLYTTTTKKCKGFFIINYIPPFFYSPINAT